MSTEATTPRNAIIVGMPRSGTSLVAAALTRAGYYTGGSRLTYLDRGDDHNPFGYFEADGVVERNVELLRRVGYRYNNTWRFDPISEKAVGAIGDLPVDPGDRTFVDAYDRSAPWLWKDQRLCFTLPYWWRLVDPSRVGVVLVLRNDLEIYRSFRRMGWCGSGRQARKTVATLTEQHVTAARRVIQRHAIPHAEVRYAQVLAAPATEAGRLTDLLGRTISVAHLNVQPELNHGSRGGAVSGFLRSYARRLPRGWRPKLERLLPQTLLHRCFPERRFAPETPLGNERVTTEVLARDDVHSLAEQEVAGRLGREPLDVAVAARRMWGRSLSEEWDSRRASGGEGVSELAIRAALETELSASLRGFS